MNKVRIEVTETSTYIERVYCDCGCKKELNYGALCLSDIDNKEAWAHWCPECKNIWDLPVKFPIMKQETKLAFEKHLEAPRYDNTAENRVWVTTDVIYRGKR